MDAKLIVVGGKANKAEISLKLPTIIGRSRDADLTMAHPMVSRQHCELYEGGGLLKIRDLGSLNGTFVGEEKIEDAELYPGTEFTVGPLTFRVHYSYAGEIAPAPAPTPAEASPETVVAPLEFLDVEEKPPAESVAAASKSGESPDAELPDFDAWADVDGDQAEEEAGAGPPPAAPGPPAGYREEPTTQADALDLPPPPPGFGEVAFSDAETERTDGPEDESARSALPADPGQEEDDSTRAPDELNDFYKGLQ